MMKSYSRQVWFSVATAVLFAVMALATSRASALVNGDFSQECDFWSFTDESEPYGGSQPWATLDCSQGVADMHLYEMYGRGVLRQSVMLTQPQRFSFDFSGLSTSDHNAMGMLCRDSVDVLLVWCEGGASAYFNRFVVLVEGTVVIEVHSVVSPSGSVAIELTGGSIVAYLNGSEIGRAPVPSGVDLACDLVALKGAISNHIDTHVAFDNVALEGAPVYDSVLLNGDFSAECEHWVFTDISEPYPGSDPYAGLDCSQGRVDMHLYEMYGRGLLKQVFAPVRPNWFSFDFDGLTTSDHNTMGILSRGNQQVLMLYCEGGSISYFNRYRVYAGDSLLIDVHDIVTVAGNAAVEVTEDEIVAYLSGAEVGRAAIPTGLDLTCDRVGLEGAISNHIDTHVYFDNAALSGTPVFAEALVNGDFTAECDYWDFSDVSEPYYGSDPYALLDCSMGMATMTLHEMYGRGLLTQRILPQVPVRFGFDFDGLTTSDHNAQGELLHGDAPILLVWCEGGSLSYFNRYMVYAGDSLVIEVHDIVPSAGSVAVTLMDGRIVAYLNGAEIGQAPIPAGLELLCTRVDLRGAISNHITTQISFDNATLLGWVQTQDVPDPSAELAADPGVHLSVAPTVFRQGAEIRFDLPASERVTLAIFDLNGRRVRTLCEDELSAGTHRMTWNGRDDGGVRAGAGVYFCRLLSGGRNTAQRLLMVK